MSDQDSDPPPLIFKPRRGHSHHRDQNGEDVFRKNTRAVLLRALATFANHPLEYAKVLIELGYEPWPPSPASGWMTAGKVLYFPSMFQYVKYIRSVDGVIGCYRGVSARVLSNSINLLVTSSWIKQSPIVKAYDDDEEGHRHGLEQDSEAVHKIFLAHGETEYFIKRTCWEVLCVAAGTVASQPLHVVAVRMMGGFVGRETAYTSLWSAITDIFLSEGVVGFFRGLTPRLIGETLTVLVSALIVYAIRRSTGDKDAIPNYVSGFVGNYIAHSYTHQFNVVSNNMIVNGAGSSSSFSFGRGLAIGRPPFTPIFDSWTDSWLYLRSVDGFRRGTSMFSRFYTGPLPLPTLGGGGGGGAAAGEPYFGPLHPPGLGMLQNMERKLRMKAVN